MISKKVIFGLCLIVSVSCSQSGKEVELGVLSTGASISFTTDSEGGYGISISGGNSTDLVQQKPAQIEVWRNDENIQQIAASYTSVRKKDNIITAKAKLKGAGTASFTIEDTWKLAGNELSLSRKVSVKGTEDSTGFYSGVSLITEPTVTWEETKFLAPGLLYGVPHTSANALGGSVYYNSKHFSMREDYLAAPLFGLYFKDGSWVAALNYKPDGSTTQVETAAPANTPIIEEQLKFGALGTKVLEAGGIDLSFRFPGTSDEFTGRSFGGGGQPTQTPSPVIRRRYHPVKDGFSHSYNLGFLFGTGESFRNLQRDSWRWAWQSLDPKVDPVDVEVMRTTLIDHLADRILIVDDRAGIPFVIDAVSGKPGSFRPALMARRFSTPGAPNAGQQGGATAANPNQEVIDWAKSIGIDIDPKAAELELWPKIVMGFCGKHVELADQLFIESDRDNSPRGQRLRDLGNMVINSLIRIVPSAPPTGEGFDIRTGQAGGVRGGTGSSLRSWAEDMRIMMDMIKRERERGREHPDWVKWAKSYGDWLIKQQREDGSFPQNWADNKGTVREGTSGVTTYAAVPFLVRMSEETGKTEYLNAAIRAADYIWTNYGSECVFLGATGSAVVADKESGMLSLEAFLSLYENTKDNKWLEYAKTAGDYTESWIWIWNVPMPIGADPAQLGWKPGVPTIGVNGIGSNDVGGVDQYLDWAVPSYAKLYKYTNDEHYLDVARILLHGTKAMLALPGRTYDLLGPGWQQEHWRMGPVRGIGAHRTWLPWVSINHLHGITGLEDFDKDLYVRLSKGE